MKSMNALSMSKSQCRKIYRNEHNQPYDKIVIGAIIFDKRSLEPHKILLLKRAAHEKYYPNIFEIPGGNVEDTDATIRDAVIREVLEETGFMEKKVVDEETGEVSGVSRTSLQLNFVCEVTGFDFRVNGDEHSEGRFVAKGEFEELNVTDQMRAVLEEAFAGMAARILKP